MRVYKNNQPFTVRIKKSEPTQMLRVLVVLFVSAVMSQYSSVFDDAFEIKRCSDDLRDLADYIRFSIESCPSRHSLFMVDDVDLSNILRDLAFRLDENMNDCPCVGPCERFDCNDGLDFPLVT